MKQCKKCNEIKDINEFGNKRTTKDGKRPVCKECRKTEYLTNKEKILKKRKETYIENKPELLKRIKEYSSKHKEKLKEYYKNWSDENSDVIQKYKKEYYENNKEIISIKGKEYGNSFILFDSIHTENIKPYEEIRQNGEFLEVKCTYCGKWYKPTVSEVKRRLQAINGTSVGENRLYCSNNCKKECPIYGQNKWPKGFKKATSREVQPELRQMVLKRDNYICQKCNLGMGELKVGLHCHHKEGIHWEPIESADMDMCLTFCKTCHEKVHQIEGCKYSDMKCKKG